MLRMGSVHSYYASSCYNKDMSRVLNAFLFLLLFGLVAPAVISAQVGTELSLTLFPEHPRPGESLSVSVESYNIDLNRAELHWYVNDRLVKTGVGDKRLEVTAGRGGEAMVIRVTALGENGLVYSASAAIKPAEVNLLWQAQSYTPPFYRGKALMPFQGTVLVAAIPSFARGNFILPAESLIYTWSEGDDVIGESSGKGKNLFAFRGSVPMRTKTIGVTVESPDRTMIASASVGITPVAPRVLFYEDHPRYGLLTGKALINSFFLVEDETRINAIPFYFETTERAGRDLAYGWQLNYAPLESEKNPFITLRRITHSAGRSTLFLEARHTDEDRSFQAAEERLVIEFPLKAPFGSAQETAP